MIDKQGLLAAPLDAYASRKEWETVYWREVIKSEDLLELLTTSHERRMIVLRAAALAGLAIGKSYRQIGRELWLSPQTISGIKKAHSERAYRSYRERSKKERKKKTYSSTAVSSKRRYRGRPWRTKYGTIYIP